MENLIIFVISLLVLIRNSTTQDTNGNSVRSMSGVWHPRTRSAVCLQRDCFLPQCFCPGKTSPSNFKQHELPQMVMLTFDDAVNEQVFEYYVKLFRGPRYNPNKCPISATFYVSHNWTNYEMVKQLYNDGHEIASHSITHRLPQSWWTQASLTDWYTEIHGQRQNIINKAGVPKEHVRGVRVPFLELGGDKQFTMMSDTGLQYDSSFMTGPHDEGGSWPYTLDYPPNWQYCSNNNCPKSGFPGLWELPMNRWIGPDGKPCAMVDACQTQPIDKDDALGYMWYNFNRFYRGNRAPFGIHLHAAWIKKDASYLDALITFLDALSEMNDVYMISASQVVDWMRNPTPITKINDFAPWRRSCTLQKHSLDSGKIETSTSVDEQGVTKQWKDNQGVTKPLKDNQGVTKPLKDNQGVTKPWKDNDTIAYKEWDATTSSELQMTTHEYQIRTIESASGLLRDTKLFDKRKIVPDKHSDLIERKPDAPGGIMNYKPVTQMYDDMTMKEEHFEPLADMTTMSNDADRHTISQWIAKRNLLFKNPAPVVEDLSAMNEIGNSNSPQHQGGSGVAAGTTPWQPPALIAFSIMTSLMIHLQFIGSVEG